MALNLIMLGAPGAGKRHAGGSGRRTVRHPKDLHRRHAARSGQGGHRDWPARQAVMDAGQLVSDGSPIGIVKERLDRDDVKAWIHSRRLSSHRGAGEVARRPHGRTRPAGDYRHPGAEDELVRRLTGRVICQNCGQNAEGVSVAQIIRRCARSAADR